MDKPTSEKLQHVQNVEYRKHTIKIARRGDQIRVLIYPPESLLATHIVVDEIANYEDAISVARAKVDRIMEQGQS